MAKGSVSRHMGERHRIKNKERLLTKLVKKLSKPEIKEKVIKNSRIGRKKEGFQPEAFKCKPPKHPSIDLGK
jgi:hypothetical protein